MAAEQKIRIGFVSGFFHHHSVWKIPLKVWIENIDRSEFELFGYYTGNISDRETARAAKAFDRFEQHHFSVDRWAEKIASDNLQVLIFSEFGMDSLTVKLGCLRLAPIQITSWGHLNTSGMPTIDYYLSSDLMESEAAQSHYTEKLIRLPNLGICYQPIAIRPEAVSKADLGIQDNEIMFWCCQSLFKYLPQHDDVFPRLAQKLDRAKFVFIKLESEFATSIFRQRLAAAFEQFNLAYQDYCIFLPRLYAETFVGVSAIADIFLDNIGWSGCNTTLECITHNLPIFTLAGQQMRGRHTLAFLKMIGVEETIAQSKDEYIQIAVRLAQDAGYRRHIAQQIALNKHKLYQDLTPIRALEDFLFQIVDKPRRFDDAKVAQAFQLGVQHQQANRLEAAQQEYLQVIAAQPQHPEALYRLGILAKSDRPEAAEKYLSASVKVQPKFLQAWFSLGNLRQSQGQYQSAEQAYRQALKLRPDSAPICNNLGYVLQRQGNWSAAASYYRQALEIEPECLASVLAQWTEDMEIIVLDNGSQPPQWEIPDYLGKGIIRYYRFPETISLQENWNTAVSLCRGQWIHLLHHDDYILPGFYARLKASLATSPESVGAAFAGYENINESRQVVFSQQHDLENHRGIVADWILRIGVSCSLSPPSLVIRRAAYEKLGGYKLDLLYTCDWEFYKRVATFYDWWYEPGILAHYREQANSITVAENMNGSSGVAHRRAIEISASYLPPEHRAEITARSRAFHFRWCLNRANIPLEVGNFAGALCLIKEALKIDNSPEAISQLSLWLQQTTALVHKLALLNVKSDLEASILVNLAHSLLDDRDRAISQETA